MRKSLFSILCSIISLILSFLIISTGLDASQATKVFNGYINEHSKRLINNETINFSGIINILSAVPSINDYVIYDMTDNIQSGSCNIGIYVSGEIDHPDLLSGSYISTGDKLCAVVGCKY